jgi:hypothetical protein
MLVQIAVSTGIPLADLMQWSLGDVNTALELIKERNGHGSQY